LELIDFLLFLWAAQARDGPRLAPEGLPLVLDLEDKPRQGGSARVPQPIRDLIRMMSRNNPRWGAPRIHGELLKLGIEITEPTVAKYMMRHRKPPSQQGCRRPSPRPAASIYYFGFGRTLRNE
jgi:hypothetical protein